MKDANEILEKKTVRLRPETLDWYEAQARAVGLKLGIFIRLVLEDKMDQGKIAELKKHCSRA